MEPNIIDIAKLLREDLLDIEKRIRNLDKHSVFKLKEAFVGQHGEMKAQAKLAVRHVEDARMRLGKVCQYADDGISILDKI